MEKGFSKELGQNMLVSIEELKKEIEIAKISEEDIVLEIGGGTGNLTKLLAEKAKKVIVIEIDKKFSKYLNGIKNKFKNIRLVWGDATKITLPKSDKVVSNLPFRNAIPLMLKIIKSNFKEGVFIIPFRMAKRICARPGEKGYSRLSVIFNLYSFTKFIKKIPKDAFEPKPRIDAAMIYIKKKDHEISIPEEYLSRALDFFFIFRGDRINKVIKGLELLNGKIDMWFKNKKIERVTPFEFEKIITELYKKKIIIPKIPEEIKKKIQKYDKIKICEKIILSNIREDLLLKSGENERIVKNGRFIGVRFSEINKLSRKYRNLDFKLIKKLLNSEFFEEKVLAIKIIQKRCDEKYKKCFNDKELRSLYKKASKKLFN